VKNVDYRATIISSCWFAVAIISVAYMWLFADKIGDILFGMFLPVGLLVLVAVIVTIVVSSSAKPENKQEA
jgi:branched-subunit amino acid permease